MGRKKNNPVEKDSIASAECKDMNNSNRLVSVEAKLDKLIDTMVSMDVFRSKKTEVGSEIFPRYHQHIALSGVHKVKKVVNWPQDYCTVASGGRQPTYDDLNVNQWVQGIIQCAVE